MQKTLLDTDSFSEILKGKNAVVQRNAAAYRSAFGVYTASVSTIMEMVKGFQRLRRVDRIDALLRGLASEEVLPVDLDAAVLAAKNLR